MSFFKSQLHLCVFQNLFREAGVLLTPKESKRLPGRSFSPEEILKNINRKL